MANGDFTRGLAALVEKTKADIDLVHRKVCLDLYRSLVLKSPVDTGRFRGNWQVGVGAADTSTGAGTDTGGQGAISRAQSALEGVKVGGIIYLTNSLPYALVLEYGQYGKPPGSASGPKTAGGYSKQTPAGMVRVTVQEYTQYIAKAVAEIKQ